uniref:Uncharacterized protein n=1 Tax=Oryza sativa subsp. japonica TaxID=39947 RepID=Q338R2_ORYSJ|nr:hypothetical protein LOC_Os10g24870 [Oryza sativa Japonica Group]
MAKFPFVPFFLAFFFLLPPPLDVPTAAAEEEGKKGREKARSYRNEAHMEGKWKNQQRKKIKCGEPHMEGDFLPSVTIIIMDGGRRAVPGQSTVPRHRPRHDPTIGPGQHRPDTSRAMPCLSRAKWPCHGSGHQASDHMAIYTND